MANEQIFESRKDEILKTSHRYSNRKRKGKGVNETTRLEKARRWCHAEVDRSRAIFLENQCGAGLSSKDSG